MNNNDLAISNICSAFNDKCIGTKVSSEYFPLNPGQKTGWNLPGYQWFLIHVSNAISDHDFSKDRVPGQAFLMVPECVPFISAGVGRKSSDPDRYFCREHRGVVSAYLKREYAEPATGCAVVVYTTEAYLKDPDITPEEAERVKGSGYVLVAVLGFAGPSSPLSPYRLVWNLAGGNHEAALWSADEIRAKAKESIEYESQWSVVAD